MLGWLSHDPVFESSNVKQASQKGSCEQLDDELARTRVSVKEKQRGGILKEIQNHGNTFFKMKTDSRSVDALTPRPLGGR